MTEFNLVHDALVNDSATATLLGDRVRPVQAIQEDPLPFAVISLVDVQPFNAVNGFAGLDMSEMQIDVWASSMIDADTISRTARRALEAQGYVCVRHINDFFDAQLDPGIFRTGFVIRLFL